jgi:chorismate mutase
LIAWFWQKLASMKEMSNRPARVVVRKCSSLDEVRTAIDEIDDAIIHLIAGRNAYVAKAARFKTGIEAAAAPERVEQVLERIRARAHLAGLPGNRRGDLPRHDRRLYLGGAADRKRSMKGPAVLR